mgnify:FL=1|tara:strand:+ start:2424 stop:3092 length:669 start_codon:yes stop_codon:yes gene_type:complete
MLKKINKLQETIKVNFKNQNLLIKSITHKSYDKKNNYEKLEFLGDRVLGLTISKKLYDLYPNEKEGILDKKLASLVNKNICFLVGKNLKLDDFIYVGKQNSNNSSIQNKIISDSCEALIGAVYLDKGFDYTEKFILKIWKSFISTSNVLEIDSKTKLQEYSLKKYKSLPIYKLISNTGPRHKPKFKVAVKLKNFDYIEATGNSKKDAEQSAAKAFLNVINEK